jgi:SNF2 family DNA or RNA helicase
MGLGKTLTAISVLWAFVRQGGCKGVVVVPSSLIDNWEREMKQWLGVKMRPLVLRPGMNAETLINSFVIGHVSLTPVMLLSYEVCLQRLLVQSFETKCLVCRCSANTLRS